MNQSQSIITTTLSKAGPGPATLSRADSPETPPAARMRKESFRHWKWNFEAQVYELYFGVSLEFNRGESTRKSIHQHQTCKEMQEHRFWWKSTSSFWNKVQLMIHTHQDEVTWGEENMSKDSWPILQSWFCRLRAAHSLVFVWTEWISDSRPIVSGCLWVYCQYIPTRRAFYIFLPCLYPLIPQEMGVFLGICLRCPAQDLVIEDPPQRPHFFCFCDQSLQKMDL